MTSRAGKDFTIQVDDGTGTYAELAGLRTTSFSINNEAIDVTSHGSNEWMELLDGAGIKKVSLSGAGVADTEASLIQVRDACLSGALLTLRVIEAGTMPATFQASFKVTTFDLSGGYNDAEQFSASFESSGPVTVS